MLDQLYTNKIQFIIQLFKLYRKDKIFHSKNRGYHTIVIRSFPYRGFGVYECYECALYKNKADLTKINLPKK